MEGDERDGYDEEAVTVALHEARRAFDNQQAKLKEIDDKAMRTLRTSILIIGFAVSAVAVAGPDAFADISLVSGALSALGILFLFGAAFLGVGIYTITPNIHGNGPQRRQEAFTQSHARYRERQLNKYGEWSESLVDEIETNSEYLEVMNFAFLGGSAVLLLSAFFVILNASFGLEPLHLLVTVVLVPLLTVVTKLLLRRVRRLR